MKISMSGRERSEMTPVGEIPVTTSDLLFAYLSRELGKREAKIQEN